MVANQSLLDYGSSRTFFLKGVAPLAESSNVNFHFVLPSCQYPIHQRRIHVVNLMKKSVRFSTYPLFMYRLLRYTQKYLSLNPNCILHHFKSCYRGLNSFNVNALMGLLEGHPFVWGPAETPHPFLYDDFSLDFQTDSYFSKVEYNILASLNRLIFIRLSKRLFLDTAEKVDALVVTDQPSKMIYRKFIPERKIHVIPIGVDLEQFRFSELPKNYDVLFVGNLISRKNVHCLIRAFYEVQYVFPLARLHIVGDGNQKENLEFLTRQLGLEHKVTFHGKVTNQELSRLYSLCRLLCQPSQGEGACNVCLEAMATGRPVVSTDTPGSWMIRNGENGFLVPSGDIHALAERIMEIFADYELGIKMGLRGRQEAERNHDWSAIAMKYYRLYQSI